MGTGWLDRYRTDLFFRTDVNIFALQAAFVVVIMLAFWMLLSYASRELATAIASAFATILSNGTPPSTASIVADVARTRVLLVAVSFLVVAVLTAAFGYLVARLTREPARLSLKSQKRFISDIAHELRTPLSIIRMNSDLALLEGDISERTRETFEKNNEELVRISDTINNLLSLTALVQAERIKLAETDFRKIVQESIVKLDDLSKTQEVTIKFVDGTARTVYGNGTALGQIAFNLVKNAIVYTPKRGTVTVRIDPDMHHQVRFTVQDTGVGIASEDLRHIFEPFYRAERSRNRSKGGSGVGLTIVAELVKLHRGSISIQSTPGSGTTVIISLPRKARATPATVIKPFLLKRRESSPVPASTDEVFLDFS